MVPAESKGKDANLTVPADSAAVQISSSAGAQSTGKVTIVSVLNSEL